LPHIVSLLFRSLTSRQDTIVKTAYVALKEVLSLSVKGKNGETQRLHRLPKNLLQMCIKPVLINLREYTKLSVPLLHGLSRLLSLLSTWFSHTLGEKLLDHLQKWTEPEKIINLGIWTRGEEVYVAAEIINLFQLLADDSSQFVEPLIKTTLKLEAVLVRYNSYFTESPFRVPLARYLNRHGSAVASFFINEHRLKNPIYSELLQDIIKRQESSDLRYHLSSTECSNMVLNVCFETPLAIIRAEKGSSPRPLSGSTSRTTVDTLSMHGIHIDLSGKKAALQKEIKIKQEKLQAAKRDAAKVESSLRKRLDNSNSSDTPQKLRLISNAKEKLAKTNAMISRLQNEINAAEADLLRKFSPTSKSISNDGDEKQPRFMTLDSLELQEQGFALIDTLMTYDNSYISQHHDVVRAFRWLWRSKGRHFRLLHEDAISPRYSGESRYLAKFLVNYSKTAPNDVDVLFDLLRIFLQPTSADFSFVQDYLRHSVCNLLTLEYQKKVMLRFFPVIASEGIEELKVLSIQLLILPMLEHNFKRMNTMLIKERHPSITICDSGNAHETETPVPLKSRTVNEDRILDEDLTAQLISGVLSSRSKQDTYGSRLTIELLKLCSLLLDYIGQNLGQHKHTLVKFAWNVLKNEDSKVKEWACITISKFVMRFDPPSKLTLRCYLSLLRAYQLETKDVVNVALDILVPSLALKLTKDEYTKAIKTTVQLLFEEANSLPQLTHLWHIILRHKNSYVDFRDMFMSPLVASLNKIGLPMNASVENRELALLLVDLAVEWDTLKTDSVTQNGDSDETLTQSSTAVRAVDATSTVRKYLSEERQHYKLQKNEISAIINFLVRLILLVAVADKSQQFLREKAMALLQMVLTRWAHFTLHIEYFDKVIAMCSQGEDCFEKLGCLDEDEMQDVGNMSAISGKKSKSPLKRQDRVFTTSNLLLSSCLEIFSHLMIEARENNFLAINCFKISPIITTCFKRIKTASDNLIRQSMKFFLITLFESKVLRTIQELCKLLLEDMILSTLNDLNDGNQPNCYSVQFALSAVEGIVSVNSQFLNSFMLPLIKILQVFLLKPPSSKTQNRQTSKSSYCSYFPVEVLFQAACEEMKPAYSMKSNGCQFIQTYTADRPFGDEEDCIVTSLQLLFKSFVPYHFSTFRRKFISLLGDILDSSIDIRVLLVVCAQVGEWISADCKKNPLTKNEVLFFLTKFTNFESRGLSEIDMQPLSYLVSLIVLRCKAGHLSSSHQSYRGESSWDQFSDSSRYTHVLNRLSASSLMSTNTLIRNTFCKLTISSDHDGRHKDNISSRHDELLSAALESVLSNLLHSDLEGLGNRMWTFIIVDSLLAICDDPTNSTAGTSQHLLSSFLNKECPSFFPSGTCLGPSSDPSVFLSALRTVSSCDRHFSQELLESLLKSAWSTLTDNKARLRLVKAMEKALNRTYHKQFLGSSGKSLIHQSSSNAVKSFLQAVALLNPLPMISVDLLLTLASNYNCWHEVRR
jgi:transformation/transcription domain-associated protein